MTIPEKRISATKLPGDTIKIVKDFYLSSEYSRILPGKNDFVSINKEHVQKQLLLCTLRELYALFKQENPYLKIGFSNFCSLRPKQCVLAGSSGTHSVCVCLIHQNNKLLLSSFDRKIKCKDFISAVVCDKQNRHCMFRLCEKCSKEQDVDKKIFQILSKKFLSPEVSEEEIRSRWTDEVVEYRQWTDQDRSKLESFKKTRAEIFEDIKKYDKTFCT